MTFGVWESVCPTNEIPGYLQSKSETKTIKNFFYLKQNKMKQTKNFFQLVARESFLIFV